MKTISFCLFLCGLLMLPASVTAQSPCYELRIYTAHTDKLDALNTRFRNHTMRLFEKHGIHNIGYWIPTNNDENQLYYLVSHESCEVRDQNWQDFINDEEWKIVAEASQVNGRLVANIESMLLKATDYTPIPKPNMPDKPVVFELRIYHTHPGRLANLNARFRDHTMRIFEKHNMHNIIYMEPLEEEQGAGKDLVYFITHSNQLEAKSSWDAFRADPDWVAAKSASEESGPIVDSIDSIFMRPTDYSPIR